MTTLQSSNNAITIAQLADLKNLDSRVLTSFGVEQRGRHVAFKYIDLEERRGLTRLRTGLRGVGGSVWDNEPLRSKCEYANGFHLLPKPEHAFLVEGESDCWVLHRYGYVGIGVPGYDSIECCSGNRFNRIRSLYLVKENRPSQATFPFGVDEYVNRLAGHLCNTGYSGDLYACTPPSRFQDISEIHLQSENVSEVLEAMILDATKL